MRSKLADILDKKNGLYQLADRLNWDYLTEELGPYYAEGPGRPEIPIRVIVGLHYLKYLENESDESVVKRAYIMQGRYAHAKQMKRSGKEFKKVRCYLGRVMRATQPVFSHLIKAKMRSN